MHFINAYGMGEEGFAKTILALYDDEGLREEFANAGREWVSKFWSMTDKAKLLVEMMKERGYI